MMIEFKQSGRYLADWCPFSSFWVILRYDADLGSWKVIHPSKFIVRTL